MPKITITDNVFWLVETDKEDELYISAAFDDLPSVIEQLYSENKTAGRLVNKASRISQTIYDVELA